jgi:hypothetical protein
MRFTVRQRALALVPIGALALHQLRYKLAFGGNSSQALAEHGHGYLGSLTPMVALACALALAELVARLATASSPREAGSPRGRGAWLKLMLLMAGGLLVIFCVQESIEGIVVGHSFLPGVVFGEGGWLAVPLALAFGALISLVVCAETALVELVARRREEAPSRCGAERRDPVRPQSLTLPRIAPLASGGAGRAPPLPA